MSAQAIAPGGAVLAHATQAIAAGSKSFSAAARLFDRETRASAVMLYAWCRHCDDLIDGQESGHYPDRPAPAGAGDGAVALPAGEDRDAGLARLAELEDRTRRACAGEPTADPVFAGLQQVVRRHGIDLRYPLEHLAGFRMDVEGVRYGTLDDTLRYCWRVAGVVGVMMAQVMGAVRGAASSEAQAAVLDRACDLGIAFQLTNIARDIVEDARIGRVYLPADWLAAAGIAGADADDAARARAVQDPRHRDALAGLAARLVDLAEPYYASAAVGLAALPWRSAWSIATARGVYRQIGWQVRARGSRAWDARVSTSRAAKLRWVAGGALAALASRQASGGPAPQRDAALWTRPR
ncbi:MAG: phytoene/squalene synthase family protein [Xylophilus ampelinus]